MSVSSKENSLVLILSSLVIIIPMVIFPAKLGLHFSSGAFTYAVFEVFYYGIVFYILHTESSLLQLIQGVGLTFLYRIIIGTIFGVIVSVMYGVDLTLALTMGVSRYFPAIILQIAAAPFIIKPFYLAIADKQTEKQRPDRKLNKAGQNRVMPRVSPIASSITDREESHLPAGEETSTIDSKPNISFGKGVNGFERAVRYLGEHQAVLLAAVIDNEGLAMATFKRGEFNSERWTPLAMLFQDENEKILKRYYSDTKPDRIVLNFNQQKITILKIPPFDLLILSSIEDDDLLGIRITQAAEIVNKYMSERYGELTPISPEEKYVSSP